ncbi:MAG: hypothetical protein R3F55_25785 [Alphaproteobacteria bacterium]
MGSRLRVVGRAAVLAAGVGACVPAQQGAAPAGGRLGVATLNQTLTGNTLVASRAGGGGDYCAFHSTEAVLSGSLIVRGTDRGQPYRGTWRVEAQPDVRDSAAAGAAGFVCYSFPDAGVFAECRMLRTDAGGGVTVLDRAGHVYASGRIVAGDACGG